ncbi:entericidin A/B family lipoprotein [Candidatus Paracaedibacter symbiosus]|uniref:entericidin A/B family lipoprotein n=1 Tax=Candidatus Paracaedibacter symbiosus TaxID=244582 RepID=UPI00050946F1
MKKTTQTILGSGTIALLMLSGCNTTQGIGEDLSKAGHAISHAANETGHKMSSDDSASTTTYKETDKKTNKGGSSTTTYKATTTTSATGTSK